MRLEAENNRPTPSHYPCIRLSQRRAITKLAESAPDAVTGFEWVSLRSPEQFAEINRRYRHALAGLKPGIQRRPQRYICGHSESP